jgi:hypothetical protein
MTLQTDSTTGPTELERHSRALLLASTDALDARLRSRLTQARHAALAALEEPASTRPFRIPGGWLPTGALAAAAVLAVAVWIAQPGAGPALGLADASPVEDAEILASNEGPELCADDPEFYEWAGSDAVTAPGNAG